MSVPKDLADWTAADHDSLSVRYCAYWVNVEGEPGVDETAVERVKVTAPKNQIFNDVALCDIMERIGRGGKP